MAHRAPTGSHRRIKYDKHNPNHTYDPYTTRTDLQSLPDDLPYPDSSEDFYQEPEWTPSYDAGKEMVLRTAIFVLCLIGVAAVVFIMQSW